MLFSHRLTRGTRKLLSQYLKILDPGTKEHNAEVVNVCQALGRRYHLSDGRYRLLIVAAQYHDLGKGDPQISNIIQQPRKPTPKEWEIINRHASISGQILEKSGVEREVINLVVAHHDPVIYSGEFLPVLVLLAMADIIQATTSKRPYRPFPMSKREVAYELEQKLGDLLALVGGESVLEEIFAYLVNVRDDKSPSLLWSSSL